MVSLPEPFSLNHSETGMMGSLMLTFENDSSISTVISPIKTLRVQPEARFACVTLLYLMSEAVCCFLLQLFKFALMSD